MAKKTPLQEVKERFGSKEALAEKVVAILDRPEGVSQDEFSAFVKTLSNTKLLRLLSNHETMTSKFGGKSGLIDAIIALRSSGKVDTTYKAKLETFNFSKLLDIHRGLERRVKNTTKKAEKAVSLRGGKDALIESILALRATGKTNNADFQNKQNTYKAKLETFGLAQLLDTHQLYKTRAKKAQRKAAKKAAK